MAAKDDSRITQLDGWRGISICLVLAAHLLPLKPDFLRLNETAALMGMSLFFTLSGYLITSFLLVRPAVKPFLVRRLCRIVPLAWLFIAVMLLIFHTDIGGWVSNLLFLLNYSHDDIKPYNSHMWSLCVEVHFYLFVAALVSLCGQRGLSILPLLCLAVTINRAIEGVPASIVTHYRVDEILAGGILALIASKKNQPTWAFLSKTSPWLALAFLILCSCPLTGPLPYLRAYAGALAVGTTLAQPSHLLSVLLGRPSLKYLATISFALYVIHGPLRTGWFAEGSNATKYLIKRPLTILLTFVLAHFSTFYWENWWIRTGRRITSNSPTPTPVATDDAFKTGEVDA